MACLQHIPVEKISFVFWMLFIYLGFGKISNFFLSFHGLNCEFCRKLNWNLNWIDRSSMYSFIVPKYSTGNGILQNGTLGKF